MSATQTRLPRAEATALAWELLALLSPYCERIEVLGSIRRQRPTVGDIELLAAPKWADLPGTNLFGEPIHQELLNLLEHQIYALESDGVLQKRQPQKWGMKYKAALYKDFPLDLFILTAPAQWGVLSILRTGSADFNKRLVTVVEKGGWMPKGMCCEHGVLWALSASGAVAIPTPTEEDVFTALGRVFVAPEDREVGPPALPGRPAGLARDPGGLPRRQGAGGVPKERP